MSSAEATTLLRPGLLDGVRVLLACAGPGEVGEGLTALGAQVARCALDPAGAGALDEAPAAEQAVEAALAVALAELGGQADLLLVDGASLFAAAPGARNALMWCMQASWTVTRATANAAFIPHERGGRVVLLAPAAGREHADAAVAGLENLARTLATEWARYGITIVAVAPGARGAPGGLATVLAYLASPAGAYFSGCLLDLRGPTCS